MWIAMWMLVFGGVLGPETTVHYFRSYTGCYTAQTMELSRQRKSLLRIECVPKWVYVEIRTKSTQTN